MKTIVVPTDFSPVSMNALNYAADMAGAIRASLSLIHVCPLPVGFTEVPISGETLQRLIDDAENSMERLKEKLTVYTGGKIKIYTEVASGGSILSQLQDYCQLRKPYAVVMASQGAGAVERLFFGSNTIAAIKHMVWPLIVVPAEAKFKNIQRIGLACDFKKVIETSPIREIKILVKEFDAKLYVIHVNTEGEEVYGPEIIEESGLLQEMLSDLHPSYHFLNNVDVEEGLSEYAEKHRLDLLIVVPKKHNIIHNLLHKSHTKELAMHTHIPVMAVHE